MARPFTVLGLYHSVRHHDSIPEVKYSTGCFGLAVMQVYGPISGSTVSLSAGLRLIAIECSQP